MCRGTLKNLKHYDLQPVSILQSDAIITPITQVHTIVTDPPYGTSASTFKRTTDDILRDFLPICYDTLKSRGFLCIAAPKTVNIKNLGCNAGFKLIEDHYLFIHRSLTREIVVFKKQ
jgi:tRNA (guanine10-N2)-dimethyltransferase